MGYVYYKTGCLLLTMLMHFVNNGAETIIELFPALNEAVYWGENKTHLDLRSTVYTGCCGAVEFSVTE